MGNCWLQAALLVCELLLLLAWGVLGLVRRGRPILAALLPIAQLECPYIDKGMHPQEVDVAIVADVGTLQRLPAIVGQGVSQLFAPSVQFKLTWNFASPS